MQDYEHAYKAAEMIVIHMCTNTNNSTFVISSGLARHLCAYGAIAEITGTEAPKQIRVQSSNVLSRAVNSRPIKTPTSQFGQVVVSSLTGKQSARSTLTCCPVLVAFGS